MKIDKAQASLQKIVVIVGATASGKSALAMRLAQKFNGEIICADSRTVYKGMDIGTAKPSAADRQLVRHHLLDIIEPSQTYSAAQFVRDAKLSIAAINSKGKLPIVVGGSGLYVDALVFDYKFGAPASQSVRQRLDRLSLADLQAEAKQIDISEQDIDFKNRRHLQRAVENGGVVKQARQLRPGTLVIGLQVDKQVLDKRIEERVESMIGSGFTKEAKDLGHKYGWSAPGLLSTSYRAFKDYCQGSLSVENAKSQFIKNDKALAKRQRTWFKRNKSIHWQSEQMQVDDLITTFLSKNSSN